MKAKPLEIHEAKIIRRNVRMQERLMHSLVLMLDFFGMQFDEHGPVLAPTQPSHDSTDGSTLTTGTPTGTPLLVTRHCNPIVCARQYRNLSDSWHNYLRITRIFKSLVELGKQDYVPSILLFILSEQSASNVLNRRVLRDSMDRFWCYCMRDRDAQATVAKAVKWVREQDGEFNGETYRRIVERRVSEGVWRFDPVEEGCARREVPRRRRSLGAQYLGRLRSFGS